jgi:hypothetical protein
MSEDYKYFVDHKQLPYRWLWNALYAIAGNVIANLHLQSKRLPMHRAAFQIRRKRRRSRRRGNLQCSSGMLGTAYKITSCLHQGTVISTLLHDPLVRKDTSKLLVWNQFYVSVFYWLSRFSSRPFQLIIIVPFGATFFAADHVLEGRGSQIRSVAMFIRSFLVNYVSQPIAEIGNCDIDFPLRFRLYCKVNVRYICLYSVLGTALSLLCIKSAGYWLGLKITAVSTLCSAPADEAVSTNFHEFFV